MSNVMIRTRRWSPGGHRNHHASQGADLPFGGEADGATFVQHTAPDIPNERFIFWTALGTTDLTFLPTHDPTAQAAFPAGGRPAEMDAWYEDVGSVPTGPPGVVFDAFSLSAGDFLDWGDTFDPFSVEPASAREDDVALTTDGGVTVTADAVWPGPDTTLLFSGWFVVGDGIEARNEMIEGQGRSAVAIALYAAPARPPQTGDQPWPPYIARIGDPADLARASRFSSEAVGLLGLSGLAAELPDRLASAAIQREAIGHLARVIDARMKELEGTGTKD